MSTISILRDLSIALTDSQLGFAEASERTNDPDLKQRLLMIGNSRAPLIEEIANELAKLGEAAPEEGALASTVHRAWVGLRDKVTGKDDPAVLLECEHAEKMLVDRYDKGITSEAVPQPLKDMFRHHRAVVQQDMESIRTLQKT